MKKLKELLIVLSLKKRQMKGDNLFSVTAVESIKDNRLYFN